MLQQAVVRVRIKKSRNSASVRIPSALMAAAALRYDQTVELIADQGCIIVSPSYDVDQMLDKMGPDTFPENVDFGPPHGSEAW